MQDPRAWTVFDNEKQDILFRANHINVIGELKSSIEYVREFGIVGNSVEVVISSN